MRVLLREVAAPLSEPTDTAVVVVVVSGQGRAQVF